jgi:hypothetical protein
VISHDAPDKRYEPDGLLWQVMILEMRQTAQIAVLLLRTHGIKPPSLTCCFTPRWFKLTRSSPGWVRFASKDAGITGRSRTGAGRAGVTRA